MSYDSTYTLLQKKNWRAITYDWHVLSTYSNQTSLYCLSDFQVAWILSNTEYLSWPSRWQNCPCSREELRQLKSGLDYNLMSCVDIQPYQIDAIYEATKNGEFSAWSVGYSEAGVVGINPNAPANFYDGDGSETRENALCTACKIYVYSYATEWITKAESLTNFVIAVALAPLLLAFGGVAATRVVGGLVNLSQETFEAMQDQDSLDNVVCCMRDNLKSKDIEQANFATSLSGCNFATGSNEQFIIDVLSFDMPNFDNFLSFVNLLGLAFQYADYGVVDCPCGDEIVWTQAYLGGSGEPPSPDWQVLDGGYSSQNDWVAGLPVSASTDAVTLSWLNNTSLAVTFGRIAQQIEIHPDAGRTSWLRVYDGANVIETLRLEILSGGLQTLWMEYLIPVTVQPGQSLRFRCASASTKIVRLRRVELEGAGLNPFV